MLHITLAIVQFACGPKKGVNCHSWMAKGSNCIRSQTGVPTMLVGFLDLAGLNLISFEQ